MTDAGKTVKDATRTMQILHFQDPTGHNAHMLMVYFPTERILVNADIYNWGGNFARYPRALTLEHEMARLEADSYRSPADSRPQRYAGAVRRCGEGD